MGRSIRNRKLLGCVHICIKYRFKIWIVVERTGIVQAFIGKEIHAWRTGGIHWFRFRLSPVTLEYSISKQESNDQTCKRAGSGTTTKRDWIGTDNTATLN